MTIREQVQRVLDKAEGREVWALAALGRLARQGTEADRTFIDGYANSLALQLAARRVSGKGPAGVE